MWHDKSPWTWFTPFLLTGSVVQESGCGLAGSCAQAPGGWNPGAGWGHTPMWAPAFFPHSHKRLGCWENWGLWDSRTESPLPCWLEIPSDPGLQGPQEWQPTSSLGRWGSVGCNPTHSPISNVSLQQGSLGDTESCAHHSVEDTESIKQEAEHKLKYIKNYKKLSLHVIITWKKEKVDSFCINYCSLCMWSKCILHACILYWAFYSH